ncbi:MAG: hypothetical protein QOG49_77 [Frankiaceae bacterium]|jgi:hypothetical protein|nr:hypothetical protein [Frankiaceae bacterium]
MSRRTCPHPHESTADTGRYTSKAEATGTAPREIMAAVLKHAPLEGTAGAVLVVQKTFSKIVVERDFSAQEVCHLGLGLPLFSSSRTFITLNLHADLAQPLDLGLLAADGDDDEPATKTTLLLRWTEREPACLPTTSLYDVRRPARDQHLRAPRPFAFASSSRMAARSS